MQNPYNLIERDDDHFLNALADEGVACVPFFPLGSFSPLQSPRLSQVAEALGATPEQVALTWLPQRSPNFLVIAGTSSPIHLRENFQATNLQLSETQVTTLDAIAKLTE